MRPVVADTSFLLPAFLSPDGRRRKLLVLFAYGSLNYYARVGIAEQERLEEELRGAAAATLAGTPIGDLVEIAADRQARLAEVLPALAPDDLCLVGSRILFDEVERKIAEVGHRLAPGLPRDAPAIIRRQLELLTPIVVPDFDADQVPAHTQGRDRRDDFLIEIALRGPGAVILSDDRRHVALDEDGTEYRDEATGHIVTAYRRQGLATVHDVDEGHVVPRGNQSRSLRRSQPTRRPTAVTHSGPVRSM